MCVVSAIGDNYRDIFPGKWPQVPNNPIFPIPEISREEFDALKKEVLELKDLLKAAKKFDEETGQPDCQMDDKIRFMRQIASALGIGMDDIFPPQENSK